MRDQYAGRSSRRTLIEVYQGAPDPARDVNRLVGYSFRCAMAFVCSAGQSDPATACDALNAGLCQNGLPDTAADLFLAWTLAVQCDAVRPIVTLPLASQGFSRDECMAVSLVAACQHARCPGLRACASALIGTEDSGRALVATSELASYLLSKDKRLSPTEISDFASSKALWLDPSPITGSERRH